MGKLPGWVGVPERTPAVERERPVGRVLAVVKVGLPAPLWVKVAVKKTLMGPLLVPGLVTVIAGLMKRGRVCVATQPVVPVATVRTAKVPLAGGGPGREPAPLIRKAGGEPLAAK